MISLGNIAYRWWITPEKDPNDPYYREVSESDATDFAEEKVGEATVYRSNKTHEISLVKPSNPIIEKVDSSFSKLAQTVFDGALTGGVLSKALSLLGFSIVRTVPGIVIGSALGAIKAYVDRYKRPKEFILCVKSERLDELARSRKELIEGKSSADQIQEYNETRVRPFNTSMRARINNEARLSIDESDDLSDKVTKISRSFSIKLPAPVSSVDQDDSKERGVE